MKTISISRWVAAVAMLFISSLATFAQVNLSIGNLAAGEKVTITFDVTLTNSFPANVSTVTNQGTVSGGNFSTVNTDDPQTGGTNDATITVVDIPPVITSATNTTFTVGINGVFNVTKTGAPTPDLFISGTFPNGVGFNPGTGNLSGTPAIGTGGVYPLVITATNITGTNVQNFTLTVLESPAIACPSNTTTNTAPGQCSQPVAFAATVTRGYPTPTVTYKIGGVTILSPYSFEPGTNVVTVTATNGVATDKTCSFTVIVKDLQVPTMNCPTDITTNAPGNCPVSVAFSAGATDNCGLTNLIATPASGFPFPLGTNLVTVFAQDLSGNTNSCTFKIIVLPGAPPTLTAQASSNNIVLSWPTVYDCYLLQSATNLTSPTWTNYVGPIAINGASKFVTNSSTSGIQFYRLKY